MTHLVRIDKGPVMDWTNDSGLDEWYRKWKKQVDVLFKGPLNGVAEGVKCNYVIYWSGDQCGCSQRNQEFGTIGNS